MSNRKLAQAHNRTASLRNHWAIQSIAQLFKGSNFYELAERDRAIVSLLIDHGYITTDNRGKIK